MFLFLNVISALTCLILDFSSGLPLTWSLVVSITNFYAIVMFIILVVPTMWTSKLTKSIIVTAMSTILIGLAIRDYSWAMDYVFPIAVGSNILLITILIITNKSKWYDYFAGLIIITMVGLVPGLFVILKLEFHSKLGVFILMVLKTNSTPEFCTSPIFLQAES